MPIYEYQCSACKETFEYQQGIKEPSKSTCEACGGKLEKLLSAGTGLIFKGSGFYITDYKTKTGGESKGADSGAAGGTKAAESKAPVAKAAEGTTPVKSECKTEK